MKIEKKQTQYENLCKHIDVLNTAMLVKQDSILDSTHLPVDTIIAGHKKLLEIGQALSWLAHVRATQFTEFIPKNGQQSPIITN